MYTQKEINKALKLYERLGSMRKVIRVLGYPAKATLISWLAEKKQTGKVLPKNGMGRKSLLPVEEQKKAVKIYLYHGCNLALTRKELGISISSATIRRWRQRFFPGKAGDVRLSNSSTKRYSDNIKNQAVLAMRKKGRSVISVSREFGVSRQTLYAWERELTVAVRSEGGLQMVQRKKKEDSHVATEEESKLAKTLKKVADLERQVTFLAKESELLEQQIFQLKLQKDVLVKVAEVIKKDGGINLETLSNREKTRVIDALRNRYKLKELLLIFRISKSSYFYQRSALSQSDKYADLKEDLRVGFLKNKQCYGYRRMWGLLRRSGKVVSEKIVRKLMKEDGLCVRRPRKRKYSSYCGEISPEVPNVLERDFHASRPNEKWLTDITEFSIPSGKVYLSPIIDCLDGMPVAWTVGTSPSAELANTMLKQALSQLKPGEHPIIHSDRGGHYRWPEWIRITEQAGLCRSMSKKGCSPDNAACEGFFGRMKNEMFYGRSWDGVHLDTLIKRVHEYMHWYREERIKMSLGGRSPAEFRRAHGFT